MLAGYLTGVLLCLAALVAGQAAMSLCGRDRPSPLAPAVGLSLLLIVADLAIKFPGRDATAAIALGVLVLASIAVLAGRGGMRIPAAPAIAAVLALLAASVPFLANGRIGPLGQGLVNDDMASHLLFSEWIATDIGATPDLVQDGYPLAPHSLVAAVAEATGATHVEVFAGLTLALAALFALTAFAALDGLGRPLRVGGAVLAALAYLSSAWLAQGAFKEPMLAFFLLAFALGLREAGKEKGMALAVPLGLVAAGALYAYSFPALAWLGAAAIAWVVLEGPGRVRAALPPAAVLVLVGIPLVAAIPETGRLIDFASFGAFDPEGEGPRVGLGNLDKALTPFEGFNIWPASDFRIDAADSSLPAPVFYLGGLLGGAAVAWGVIVAWGRRETALLAGLAAGAIGYVGAVIGGTPYTSAKGLMIFGPIAMVIALRGLLGERSPAGDGAEASSTLLDRLAPLRIPLAVVFIIGAAVSSFLPLRAAAVGPDDHADEVRSFRGEIDGRRVLFFGRDQFISWQLIGSKVATPVQNYYNQKSIGNRYEPNPSNVKLDFDAVTSELLDFYAFVITTRGAFQSAPPPNFKKVAETESYRLWERTGPTPPREVLEEPRGPGAVLDCSTPEGKALVERGGTATILPAPPVVGPEAGWQPSPKVTQSRDAVQELALTPGRWSISLQYASTQDITMKAPGLDWTLPASLDFRGPSPFWEVAEIEVVQGGPVPFELSIEDPPLLGRLIGADAQAFPLSIAATPVGESREVPVAQACGRYVDYLTPPG